jgi:hypothetical protein
MKHYYEIFALVALVFFAASTTFAQDAQPGTAEERRACEPDVYRLCSVMIPNVNRIVDCLKASESQLSPACRAVMFPSSSSGDPTGTATVRKKRGGA